jgi:hypothetical protein
VTTEVCAFYQGRLQIPGPDGAMGVQQRMRHEWQRTGLRLARANDACGVTNVWRLAPLHGVERVNGTMRRAGVSVGRGRAGRPAPLRG